MGARPGSAASAWNGSPKVPGMARASAGVIGSAPAGPAGFLPWTVTSMGASPAAGPEAGGPSPVRAAQPPWRSGRRSAGKLPVRGAGPGEHPREDPASASATRARARALGDRRFGSIGRTRAHGSYFRPRSETGRCNPVPLLSPGSRRSSRARPRLSFLACTGEKSFTLPGVDAGAPSARYQAVCATWAQRECAAASLCAMPSWLAGKTRPSASRERP